MKKSKKSIPKFQLGHGGFTLVELMATVAIVGVLAAIAIPNYIKYQRKARQTEAKVALSSLFTAESSARQSPDTGNSFHACLSVLGVAVTGASYYSVGFANGTASSGGCGPNGALSCLNYSYNGTTPTATCVEGDATTRFIASSYADPAVAPITGAQIATTNGTTSTGTATGVTRSSFQIGATGAIGGGLAGAPTFDNWIVNDSKMIFQTSDGVN